MKRYFKSILCCVIALIMVLSSTTVAFASNDVTPIIVIHGMGSTPLYRNPNTESQEELTGFDMSKLLGTGGIVPKLLAIARGDNVDPDDIIDALKNFMAPYDFIACDSNGNSASDIGINNYWTDSLANHTDYLDSKEFNEPAIWKQICDKVGSENVFAFNYDWRLDACENAKKLNTFINNVKAQTGKSKVTIVSGSEGTIVASAYIDAYKNKNYIKRLVFLDGAFNGVNVTKAFKQDLVFDNEVIMEYLRTVCRVVEGQEYDLTSLKFIVSLLGDSVDNLCDYLNDIVNDPVLLNKVYTEVFASLVTIPALWEFIPYNDFNACVNKMSSIGLLDKSSGLYSKISKYHKVQGRLESNLKELKNKGVEIAIVAKYGTPAIPVTSAYKEHSDILIDTKLATLGATVADYSKTLNRSGKYVSPDKIIDASTCVLSDNTWFIKGIQHMNFIYGTQATDFFATLVTTNAKLNVSSIEKETGVGQFIGADKNQNIVKVTNVEGYNLAIGLISFDDTTKSDVKKSPLTGSDMITQSVLIAFSLSLIVTLGYYAIAKKKKAY